MRVENIINAVINNFDFNIVYRVMVALDWHYGSYDRSPTIGELQELAEKLCQQAIEKRTMVGCGGFVAFSDGENITLMFTIEDCSVEKDDKE